MRDSRKLKVWENAHVLAPSVYRVTRSFPKEELYGLTSQLRRSCSSIPANTLPLLNASDHERLAVQAVQVKQMLTGLIRKLKAES